MSPGFQSLMWYLLYGTRGGPNRRRLLEELNQSPANAHRLATRLGLDYRTVRHHLRVLERSGAVTRPVGDAYATPYEICAAASAYLENHGALPDRSRPFGRTSARPSAARSAEG